MSNMRFLMVGGFLGAGKTTTLGRLANSYMVKGLRVGIVTAAFGLMILETAHGQF
jgi:G3E family GTPase